MGGKPTLKKEGNCSCRNLLFSLLVMAVLLQLVHYSRAPDRGFFTRNLSLHLFRPPAPPPLHPSHPVTSILLVSSNPRSGSSFTGELLSASTESSFFFEPLWHFVDTQHSPTLEDKRSLLLNMLQCNFHDPRIKSILRSDKQSTFIFRKPSTLGVRRDSSALELNGFYRRMEMRCRRTRTRVLKTIRLDMTELLTILSSLPERGTVNRDNLFIIYLARDPRGVLNSVRALPSQWPPRLLSPHHICSRLLNDSVQVSGQNLSQLMVLRYEDLAAHPAEQLARVEEQFNISLGGGETRRFVQDHSQSKWVGSQNFRTGRWGTKRRAAAPRAVPHRQEDPVKQVLQEVVGRQEELEVDVIVEKEDNNFVDTPTGQEMEEEETGVDYYDEKGKFATVRRKRMADDKLRRRRRGQRGDRDPQGRNFYYSTYRSKDFSPDHWRQQLPGAVLQEVAKEPACREALTRFHYPDH